MSLQNLELSSMVADKPKLTFEVTQELPILFDVLQKMMPKSGCLCRHGLKAHQKAWVQLQLEFLILVSC